MVFPNPFSFIRRLFSVDKVPVQPAGSGHELNPELSKMLKVGSVPTSVSCPDMGGEKLSDTDEIGSDSTQGNNRGELMESGVPEPESRKSEGERSVYENVQVGRNK